MRDRHRTRREILGTLGVAAAALGGASSVTGTTKDASAPPTARFTYAPASPNPGESVAFNAGGSDDDGSIESYEWDFDADGETEVTGETTVYSFESAGSYDVTLTVTDDEGLSDSETKTVEITNQRPDAQFSVTPSDPSPGEEVTFDAGDSNDPDGSIVAYEWDFDDDTTATGETATHTFSSTGPYDVTLTVTDDEDATGEETKTVEVSNAAPEAAFDYAPAVPDPGEDVTFDASDSTDSDGEIVEYSWDIPEGSYTDSGVTTTYAFDSIGQFDVTLTVTDDAGATDEETRTVSVANEPPTAAFTYTPGEPSPGETVSFDASDSTDSDGSVESYEWSSPDTDFEASGRTASFAFSSRGSYDVVLTVTDDAGATDSRTRTVEVTNRVPTAQVSVSPTDPQAGDPVTFDGSGSSDPDGQITEYRWSFPDGTAEFGDVVERAFETAGSRSVELRVTDDDGATDTETVTVDVSEAPTATPTPTSTPTESPTATPSPTASPTATPTPTGTPTESPAGPSTATPTATPTPTGQPTTSGGGGGGGGGGDGGDDGLGVNPAIIGAAALGALGIGGATAWYLRSGSDGDGGDGSPPAAAADSGGDAPSGGAEPQDGPPGTEPGGSPDQPPGGPTGQPSAESPDQPPGGPTGGGPGAGPEPGPASGHAGPPGGPGPDSGPAPAESGAEAGSPPPGPGGPDGQPEQPPGPEDPPQGQPPEPEGPPQDHPSDGPPGGPPEGQPGEPPGGPSGAAGPPPGQPVDDPGRPPGESGPSSPPSDRPPEGADQRESPAEPSGEPGEPSAGPADEPAEPAEDSAETVDEPAEPPAESAEPADETVDAAEVAEPGDEPAEPVESSEAPAEPADEGGESAEAAAKPETEPSESSGAPAESGEAPAESGEPTEESEAPPDEPEPSEEAGYSGAAGAAAGTGAAGAAAGGGPAGDPIPPEEVTDPAVGEVATMLVEAEEILGEADDLLHEDVSRARPRYRAARDAFQRALDVAQDNDVEVLNVEIEGETYVEAADILDRIADANDGLEATS